MVGRGSGTVTGSSAVATGGILNTGIPGMSGNPDMRYTGVVRMRGMPYRLVRVIIDCGLLVACQCSTLSVRS